MWLSRGRKTRDFGHLGLNHRKISPSSYFKSNGKPVGDFRQDIKTIIFAFQRLYPGFAVENGLEACQSECLETVWQQWKYPGQM